jgi:hypothetical protein
MRAGAIAGRCDHKHVNRVLKNPYEIKPQSREMDVKEVKKRLKRWDKLNYKEVKPNG